MLPPYQQILLNKAGLVGLLYLKDICPELCQFIAHHSSGADRVNVHGNEDDDAADERGDKDRDARV